MAKIDVNKLPKPSSMGASPVTAQADKAAQMARNAELNKRKRELAENQEALKAPIINPKAKEDMERRNNTLEAQIADIEGMPEIRDEKLQENQLDAEDKWVEQEKERQKLHGEPVVGVEGLGHPVEPQEEPAYTAPQSFADYVTSGKSNGNRDYLIADSIAKFLRNTGKDIGNVAAAYSGGTMNNDRETSLLEDRLAQRAQAETEEGIKSDFANSKLGQSLRMGAQEITANDITNANRSDQRAWGKAMIARFFDENGKLKPGADKSPDFQNMVTLANQVISGGGQVDNVVTALFKKIMQGVSGF